MLVSTSCIVMHTFYWGWAKHVRLPWKQLKGKYHRLDWDEMLSADSATLSQATKMPRLILFALPLSRAKRRWKEWLPSRMARILRPHWEAVRNDKLQIKSLQLLLWRSSCHHLPPRGHHSISSRWCFTLKPQTAKCRSRPARPKAGHPPVCCSSALLQSYRTLLEAVEEWCAIHQVPHLCAEDGHSLRPLADRSLWPTGSSFCWYFWWRIWSGLPHHVGKSAVNCMPWNTIGPGMLQGHLQRAPGCDTSASWFSGGWEVWTWTNRRRQNHPQPLSFDKSDWWKCIVTDETSFF